ncbi:hypothetical protein ACFCP7_10245 [Paenibacillus elgii]
MANILHHPISLEFLKEKKLTQLRLQCEHRILSGFSSVRTKHKYSYSVYDQINTTGQIVMLLADDSITDVVWKTEDQGFVKHTREEFISVVSEADAHKKSCLTRYRQLKEQLNVARNVEELEHIQWE